MLPLRCTLSLLLLCALAGLGAARPTNCTKVKGQFEEAIAYFDKLNCGVTEQQCNVTCEKVACYLYRYNGVCNLTYTLDDENHRQGCGHSYPCIEQYEKTCPQGCVHGTCQKRKCVCETNWAGAACTDLACSDQTCLNGGVCGDEKSCSCTGNFTGSMCQFTFPATAWDNRNNNPQNVKQAPSFTFSFASLPLEGKLTTIPWSDTYWPSMESGIAHRYYAEEPNDFNYDLHSKEELQSMTFEQMQQLSPAEKYDAFVGRYDFPTVKSEWQRTHPNDASWEGLCHGWAPASFAYKSPSPVNLTNPDGIVVPFGASDVKGLLTYFVGQYQTETGVEHDDLWFLGGRCNVDIERNPARENTSSCADIHPGSFHVLLANTVGKLNTGFVADIDRNYAVWNQPVFYYNTRILSISKENHQVTVATRMNYTKELVPDFDKQNPYSQFQDYEYTLDLDDSGQIVGGSWVSWNRPDFTWMHGVGDFYGYFEQLRTVYEQATGGPTIHSLTGKPLPHRKPVSSYRNHVHMTDATGEIGTLDQRRHSRSSWTIAPASASRIVINIKMLDTERHHGLVKIYEGPAGEGALVAVVSGSSVPEPIVVNASAVFVEFVTDVIHDPTLTSSFKATYITM